MSNLEVDWRMHFSIHREPDLSTTDWSKAAPQTTMLWRIQRPSFGSTPDKLICNQMKKLSLVTSCLTLKVHTGFGMVASEVFEGRPRILVPRRSGRASNRHAVSDSASASMVLMVD